MLSERIRPDSEAAPWVIEEVKALEAEVERLRQQNAELVEALKWIVKEDRKANQFRTADYHGGSCKCWRCAIDNADALIAKATGGE